MRPTESALPAGVVQGQDGQPRCWWCVGDPLYERYHDAEWGRPVADERRLFEKLCLEGFQAGLSWLTILRKRDNFRAAFSNFDVDTVAGYEQHMVERLLGDAGIIRHRGKIESTINNARRCLGLREEFGGLAPYVWRFEPDPGSRPALLDQAALLQMSTSPAAHALSKDLRRRGWSFVGPTTVYAFMQAMGLVNDHLHSCATREEVDRERAAFDPPR